MKILSTLFLASLLLGQIGGIPVYPGVVVYAHDILLVILVAEGFVQYALSGKFTGPRLAGPILLFIFAATLSLLTNSGRFAIPQLEVAAMYLGRWVLYGALYVLVIQIYTKLERWLYGLYITGVGVGVLGLLQFFLYPDLRNLSYLGWDPHFYRLFSTFLDPNFAGIYLVLTILLGMYLWQEKRTRIWVIAGELIALAGLLLTYSRSSYLALITGLVLVAAFKKQWILILGVAAFIAIIFYLPKTSGSTLNLLRTDSTFARVGNWKEGITLIMQAPVVGHGFNTLRYLSAQTGEVISKSASGLDSSILFVGATAGIAGMAAYGYLVLSAARMARSLATRKKFTVLGVTYLVSLGAIGVHSLFVNSAFYPWVLIWMWVLTGAVEKVSGGKSLSS